MDPDYTSYTLTFIIPEWQFNRWHTLANLITESDISADQAYDKLNALFTKRLNDTVEKTMNDFTQHLPRTCTVCGETKKIIHFNHRSETKLNVKHICKLCEHHKYIASKEHVNEN